jgi:hypothetical protein
MNVRDKMLKSYFKVGEAMNKDEQISMSSHCFHRTKKYAFFVEARRLNDDGYLSEGVPYIPKSHFKKGIQGVAFTKHD